MPIGKNVNVGKKGKKGMFGKTDKRGVGDKKSKSGPGSRGGIASPNTKLSVYIRADLLDAVRNFAYWEVGSNFTEALNLAIKHGLKGKRTDPRPKPKYKL